MWVAPSTLRPINTISSSMQHTRLVPLQRPSSSLMMQHQPQMYATSQEGAQPQMSSMRVHQSLLNPLLGLAFSGVFTAFYALLRVFWPGATKGPNLQVSNSLLPLNEPAWSMASTSEDGWTDFVAVASGEWEGYLVDCEPDGTPKDLPHYVVPESYKEWGQELYDWQQRCLMCGDADTLVFSQERFYPTAGCEVDATTVYDKVDKTIAKGEPGLLWEADGSYSLGPVDFPTDTEPCYLTFCLASPGEKRKRIRVEVKIGAFEIMRITAAMEWYEGPYNTETSLPTSCGGENPYLTAQPALTAEEFQVDMTNLDSTVPVQQVVQVNGGISIVTQTNTSGGFSVQLQWDGRTYTRTWSLVEKYVAK